MNNNFIKINNEQEEDNEEFMYPINDENRKKSTNELITGFLSDITTLLDGFNNLSFNKNEFE